MKSTIKDVARYANVSPATVSLVMNQKPGVNAGTRERVMAAIERLDYRPNQIARNLITKKTFTVGLIVTNITNPFFGELVSGIQKEIDVTPYHLLLGISSDDIDKETKALSSMLDLGLDGLLIVPSRNGEDKLEHLYQLKAAKIPFVFVSSAYNGIQADCVMSDLEQAMYDATLYSLKQGKRKIYFITETKELLLSSERIHGYVRAFGDMKAEYRNEWILETNPTVENGILEMEKILLRDKPDTVITVNAQLSLGVMKCLRDYNLNVPEDISVISFDEISYSSVLYAPVTTLEQPLESICKEALSCLIKRIEGNEDEYQRKLLPVKMILST